MRLDGGFRVAKASRVGIEKAANDLALEIAQDAGCHKSSIYWNGKLLALVDAVLLEAAREIEESARFYPEDIFTTPPRGEHGKTVDGCSAAAIRAVLPGLGDAIRALRLNP